MSTPSKAALVVNTAGKKQHSYVLSDGPAGTTIERQLDPGVFAALADLTTTVESGLLPDGVVSYRRVGNAEQFAVVLPPAIRKLFWGERERGPVEIYHVAMPYQVITIEWLFSAGHWNLIGCRFFFSPVPILDLDAPLSHADVANLNCIGYGDTSVGWVCLYHNGPVEHRCLTPADRVANGLLRVSGNEAYNNANMYSTMGPTFYRAQRPAAPFLHDPRAWDSYTEQHGLNWVLDPDLWVPILTGQHQQRHEAQGKPLTLRQALYDPHVMYYHQAAVRPLTSPSLAKQLVVETLQGLITSGALAGKSYITGTKTTQ